MSRIAARRKKIRQVKMFLLMMVVVFTLVVLSTFVFGQNEVRGLELPVDYTYETVVVYYGDTIWSIAEAYLDDDYYDLEAYVDEIMVVNNMSNTYIQAGHTIMVPVVIE